MATRHSKSPAIAAMTQKPKPRTRKGRSLHIKRLFPMFLFPMFHLFFRRMLQMCLARCCICFTYVASVLSGCCVCCNGFQVFSGIFASVSYVCCNLQVFQLFLTYVACVSSRCYKSRSRCCICCNGYTRMFQCILQMFQLL
jgi:hypothetical protein